MLTTFNALKTTLWKELVTPEFCTKFSYHTYYSCDLEQRGLSVCLRHCQVRLRRRPLLCGLKAALRPRDALSPLLLTSTANKDVGVKSTLRGTRSPQSRGQGVTGEGQMVSAADRPGHPQEDSRLWSPWWVRLPSDRGQGPRSAALTVPP